LHSSAVKHTNTTQQKQFSSKANFVARFKF
jgi:hypothetical protein